MRIRSTPRCRSRKPNRSVQTKPGGRVLTSAHPTHVAITGATGFIGAQLVADCRDAGLSISALTRRDRSDADGIRWVKGDLFDPSALADLVDGADCVIHLAGATSAVHREDFKRINTDSTQALANICAEKGVAHFVFMSSLAATRPDVSPYAASKAQAERGLSNLGGDMSVTVIRAPAVLGPGDDATYPLFSNLARGILTVPGGPGGIYRFSVIDVIDLTKLILQVVQTKPKAEPLLTPYGHQSLGWQDVAESAQRVLQRPIRQMTVPATILRMIAGGSDLVARIRGKSLVFSRDKLNELHAGDWIGTSGVDNPVPLDETMQRCLAQFQK